MPADYTAGDVEAIKALASGTANADQQKRAIHWIINTAAGAYELSYRSDGEGGERETAFAEGRRFVGLQLVKLVNMSGSVLTALRKTNV
jgi:hypothetical protein